MAGFKCNCQGNQRARKSILSFGSGSFDEPREELLELKNQQEVLL